MEGGDFVTSGHGNPKPKISIYGYEHYFEDESFELKHNEPGLLSLINCDQKHSNGNLFRITAGECPQFDSISVVFGKVIDDNSLKVVKQLSAVPVNAEYRPKYPVVVRECG